MAALTQIAGTFTASAKAYVYASSSADVSPPHDGFSMLFNLGGKAYCNVSGYPEYVGGEIKLFVQLGAWAELGTQDDWSQTSFYLDLDDQYHEFNITLSVTLSVFSEATDNPFDSKAAVTHAKERECGDEWGGSLGQTVTATIEDQTASVTSSEEFFDPSGTYLNFAGSLGGHFWEGGFPALKWEDIYFNAATINADNLDEYKDPHRSGPSWTGERMHVYGEGNCIYYSSDDYIASANFTSTEYASPPVVHSFSGLRVLSLGGELLDDLEVWFSGAQQWDAASGQWKYLKKTISEWQSTTIVPNYGIYSWDDGTPPDGAIKTLYNAMFWIDLDSAIEHQLEGFNVESVSPLSFEDDSCIEIDGWPLDATGRDVSPYFSDVATIDHRDNVGIYGPTPALAHDDWIGSAGITGPDVNGDFTVTDASNATLVLYLPSNYDERLGLVRTFEAPEGVPMAYMTRKADWYVDDGEDPEAVYCWLGWRYLRIPMDVPETSEVTVKVYYVGRYSFTDNHYTDSTRQEDFEFTPGGSAVLESTIEVEAGNDREVIVDLRASEPMYLVTHIEVTVNALGEWRIGEPELVLDIGEDLPGTENDREAVTPHWNYKFFEHYAYREGGISAITDGHRCAIEWPDHFKQNTLETEIGGNFDYRTGRISGIDFTAAWPLSTMLSNIERCCDAWSTTYSQAVADAHLKDVNGNVLKTLSVTDIVPCDGSVAEQTEILLAIRVGKWTCAPGLHYDWHTTKYVHGAGHGSSETRGATVNLYRRDATHLLDWSLIEEILADGHGYWRSRGHEVIYDGTTLYEYATSNTGSGTLGRFAVREWVYGHARGAPIAIIIDSDEQFPELLIIACHHGDDGELYYSARLDDVIVHGPPSGAPGENPKSISAYGNRYAVAMSDTSNELALFYHRDGALYGRVSKDYGESFGDEIMLIDGTYIASCYDPLANVYHVAYYRDGNIYYSCRNNDLSSNRDDVLVVSGVEEQRPDIVVSQETGTLCILYYDDGLTSKVSVDGGFTWQ